MLKSIFLLYGTYVPNFCSTWQTTKNGRPVIVLAGQWTEYAGCETDVQCLAGGAAPGIAAFWAVEGKAGDVVIFAGIRGSKVNISASAGCDDIFHSLNVLGGFRFRWSWNDYFRFAESAVWLFGGVNISGALVVNQTADSVH